LKIRIANKTDLPEILDLLSLIIRYMDAEGIKQWPKWYPNDTIIAEDITKKELIVAEEKEQLIAMVTLSPIMPEEYDEIEWLFTKGKVNSIHRLGVHPVLKTPNLAQQMMNFAEDSALKQGYCSIRLDTYSENEVAKLFYKKIGYHYRGTINLAFMPNLYHCFEKSLC
jgi:ribosomal protein S18 acetylase RimI-like enzyme